MTEAIIFLKGDEDHVNEGWKWKSSIFLSFPVKKFYLIMHGMKKQTNVSTYCEYGLMDTSTNEQIDEKNKKLVKL